jgi:hypothetical protein
MTEVFWVQRMDITVPVNTAMLSGDLVVTVDSTSLKVTNRREWMREKWKVRRGWIKVHAMIDVETNQILSLEVTDEATQDDQVFEMLLNQVEQNSGRASLKNVLGDGAYDRNHCFNELEKKEFDRVSRPGSMHHEDPVDLQIEQNVFENGMTWAGMDHGQRTPTMG